jgi:hypothetical protein
MTFLNVANILLLLGGCVSAWLVSQPTHKRKTLGFTVGLFCQPLWFFTMVVSANYGIAVLSVWYAYTNFLGFKNHNNKSDIQQLAAPNDKT